MNRHDRPKQIFLGLHEAAFWLGLPVTYLRDEAAAGRIPHLRIGQRYRFNLASVERALSSRAAGDSAATPRTTQP